MGSYRDAVKQRSPLEQLDEQARGCYAHGCPMRASVSIEGGRWFCSWHAGADSDRWQSITHELRQHDWLFGLIGDVQKLWRKGRDDDARRLATEFWRGQDERMVPAPKEALDAYLQRLRAELAYRVGASTTQPASAPAPRKAAALPAGIVSAASASEAAA